MAFDDRRALCKRVKMQLVFYVDSSYLGRSLPLQEQFLLNLWNAAKKVVQSMALVGDAEYWNTIGSYIAVIEAHSLERVV